MWVLPFDVPFEWSKVQCIKALLPIQDSDICLGNTSWWAFSWQMLPLPLHLLHSESKICHNGFYFRNLLQKWWSSFPLEKTSLSIHQMSRSFCSNLGFRFQFHFYQWTLPPIGAELCFNQNAKKWQKKIDRMTKQCSCNFLFPCLLKGSITVLISGLNKHCYYEKQPN